MASIPERGDWITFPLEQHEVIQLEWFDKKTTQTAKYYVDKCWFGRRKDNAQCGEGLIPIGETIIFIAAEYIEARMQGAPHLQRYHLADRMRALIRKENPSEKISAMDKISWGLFQLDSDFQYGQNKKQTFRWIVYHPPVFTNRPRKMFQHRFTDNAVTQTVIDTIGGIAGAAGSEKDGTTTIMKAILGLFAANFGDLLHDFVEGMPSDPQYGSESEADGSTKERGRREQKSPGSTGRRSKSRSKSKNRDITEAQSLPKKERIPRAQSVQKQQRGTHDLNQNNTQPQQPIKIQGPGKTPPANVQNLRDVRQMKIKQRNGL